MNKEQFATLLQEKIVITDGSTGAELTRLGMPAGVCVEQWILENPQILIDLQRRYVAAGSHFVLSPTFGASPIKLRNYGLEDQTESINRQLVELSRQAVGSSALVAADIGPTGEFLYPMGQMTLEEMIDVYKRQIKGILEAQPDFFLLETFMDVAEARAAVIAIKECCDLPFAVSMTFDPSGRTLTGATPESVAIIFTALGASAVGCNCSGGPDSLLKAIRSMRSVTDLPLIAKPNAGLPELIDGKAVFSLGAEEFGKGMISLLEAGTGIVGGCCGTNPEHIARLAHIAQGFSAPEIPGAKKTFVASQREWVEIDANGSVAVIGERINPSGKPQLTEELIALSPYGAMDLAMEQQEQGARIIDINAGVAGVDETAALSMLVSELSGSVTAPFCIDSADADALIAALRLYPGRAIANSVVPGPDAKRVLEAAKFYGAIAVLMPMKDFSLPETCEQRLNGLNELLPLAESFGFTAHDLLIDCVTAPAATAQKSVGEALKFLQECNRKGYLTIAGVSNVSFGLPNRTAMDAAWLCALVNAGLSAAILNPLPGIMDALLASQALANRDEYCISYIKRMR